MALALQVDHAAIHAVFDILSMWAADYDANPPQALAELGWHQNYPANAEALMTTWRYHHLEKIKNLIGGKSSSHFKASKSAPRVPPPIQLTDSLLFWQGVATNEIQASRASAAGSCSAAGSKASSHSPTLAWTYCTSSRKLMQGRGQRGTQLTLLLSSFDKPNCFTWHCQAWKRAFIPQQATLEGWVVLEEPVMLFLHRFTFT